MKRQDWVLHNPKLGYFYDCVGTTDRVPRTVSDRRDAQRFENRALARREKLWLDQYGRGPWFVLPAKARRGYR